MSAKDIVQKARKKTNLPKEASIVATILKRLNAVPGCKAEKVHGGPYGKRGKPDITGCFNGRRFDIEIKVPGNTPTPEQLKEIEEWRKVGGIAGWATSWERVTAIFRESGVSLEGA